MHMIGHKNPRVDRDPDTTGVLIQPTGIIYEIGSVQETAAFVVASLNDVDRDPARTVSWFSSHGSFLVTK